MDGFNHSGSFNMAVVRTNTALHIEIRKKELWQICKITMKS